MSETARVCDRCGHDRRDHLPACSLGACRCPGWIHFRYPPSPPLADKEAE